MTPSEEIATKLHRVRRWLDQHQLDGLFLATCGGFAWITGGGRNHVSLAGDPGVGGVLVTQDEVLLVADNIESVRLLEEEAPHLPARPVVFDWWSGGAAAATAGKCARLAADVPFLAARALLTADGIALRTPLLPTEIDRYRRLGEDAAVAITHAAFHCRPGLSERQLAGLYGAVCVDMGIDPLVMLVAVDRRIASRRHPLPTDARLTDRAMLVLTGRRHGLHVSLTRMVAFGEPDREFRDRLAACARVDAAMIGATLPGASVGAVFSAGVDAYAAEGYPGEWKHHHQGGPTGYGARDAKATPGSALPVLLDQAFAWNPTIAGTKSEDTVLIREAGAEVLTATPDLPVIPMPSGGNRVARPDVLVR